MQTKLKPEKYGGFKIHFTKEYVDLKNFPQYRKNNYFDTRAFSKTGNFKQSYYQKVIAYINDEAIAEGKTKKEAFEDAKKFIKNNLLKIPVISY